MTSRLPAIQAIVFDLDGTLVDSLDDIAGNLDAALVEAGLPRRTRDEVRAWVGSGAAQLVARAVDDPARVPDVLARFRAHYDAAPYGRTHLYPGLPAALDRLATRYKLGVLSNKPHELVTRIAGELLARWPFAGVFGERAGVPKKPDPGAVRAVADALGVPAEYCALVGDSEIDVAAARAAGVLGIAVTWGLRDAAALAAAAPDLVVATPAELADLFA